MCKLLLPLFILGSCFPANFINPLCKFENIISNDDSGMSGWIASYTDESLNGTYPAGLPLCLTMIEIPFNTTVKFEFTKLDLQYCDQCHCDAVMLQFDDMEETLTALQERGAPMICGQLNNSNHHYWSPTYWSGMFIINFHTDEKIQLTGFNLSWWAEYDLDYMPCRNGAGDGNGGDTGVDVTKLSGTLSSHVKADGNYRNHETCTWFFNAQPGYVFEFQFTKVDLDWEDESKPCGATDVMCPCEQGDIVAIHEDDLKIGVPSYLQGAFLSSISLQNANFLTARCGRQAPEFVFTGFSSLTYVLYQTGALKVKGSGFSFHYWQVPAPCNRTIDLEAQVNSTGIFESSTRIEGSLKGFHRGNENCKWTIRAENRAVRLWFSAFDLVDDCSNDYLRLTDGEGGEAKVLAVFCSSNKPDLSEEHFFETTTNVATLHFKTNHVIEGKGFRLNYKAVEGDNLPCKYSTLLSGSQKGEIFSVQRRLDGNYRTSEDCSWLIKVQDGYLIKLTFTKIDIDDCDSSAQCPCDSVAIFDGRDKTYPILADVCGRKSSSTDELLSSGSEVLVNFRTDSELTNATGFNLKYEAVKVDDAEMVDSQAIWIITASVGGLLLCCVLAAIVLAVYISKSRKPIGKESALAVGNYITPAANFKELLHEIGHKDLIQKLEQISISPECLIIEKEANDEAIGSGMFGIVKKGKLQLTDEGRTIEVAVKIVRSPDSPEVLVDFIREAVLMAPLDHPNILKCLGVSIIGELPHLAMPFMRNGSLQSFLRQSKRQMQVESKTLEMILEFCKQIASGMAYMSHRGYIHRDLACRNVLVDEYLVAKISDFGLARVVADGSNYYRPTNSQALPIKWLPPEALMTNLFDMKSDVWSFGVLMWEAFTFCEVQPYADMDSTQVIRFVTSGKRLAKPDKCAHFLYSEVILKCWSEHRTQRLSFSAISKVLDEFKREELL